jgi:hypothetical protein
MTGYDIMVYVISFLPLNPMQIKAFISDENLREGKRQLSKRKKLMVSRGEHDK